MLYISNIYLKTGSLYILTTFIQLSVPSSNHKSYLFFYEWVCFWSIIDLQHYVSSCYRTWWLVFLTFQNDHHIIISYCDSFILQLLSQRALKLSLFLFILFFFFCSSSVISNTLQWFLPVHWCFSLDHLIHTCFLLLHLIFQWLYFVSTISVWCSTFSNSLLKASHF